MNCSHQDETLNILTALQNFQIYSDNVNSKNSYKFLKKKFTFFLKKNPPAYYAKFMFLASINKIVISKSCLNSIWNNL